MTKKHIELEILKSIKDTDESICFLMNLGGVFSIDGKKVSEKEYKGYIETHTTIELTLNLGKEI
jgi:hypothetical protein